MPNQREKQKSVVEAAVEVAQHVACSPRLLSCPGMSVRHKSHLKSLNADLRGPCNRHHSLGHNNIALNAVIGEGRQSTPYTVKSA